MSHPPAGAEPKRLAAWMAGGALLLQAYFLLASDVPVNLDSMDHHLGSRYALRHPELFLDALHRPLPTLVFMAGAWAGYGGSALLAILISTWAAVETAALAREMGLRRSECAIPLVILQFAFLRLSFQVMTEPLFVLILVLALRAEAKGRTRLAASLVSLSLLARLEGAAAIAAWGLNALLRRRRGECLLLLAGPAAWAAASAWWLGSPLGFIWQRPYPLGFGHLPVQGIARLFDEGLGPVLFVLAQAGAVRLAFGPREGNAPLWRDAHIAFGSVFFFMAVLFPSLHPLPEGYLSLAWARHAASAGPWIALLALRGLNALPEGGATVFRLLRALFLLEGAALGGALVLLARAGKADVLPLAAAALLAALAAAPFFLPGAWRARPRWPACHLALALLAALWWVEPIRNGPAGALTRQAAEWIARDGGSRPLAGALHGIFYLLDRDPYTLGLRPPRPAAVPPSTLWVWDGWAAGRWHRIPREAFREEDGFHPLKEFRLEGNRIIIFERRP